MLSRICFSNCALIKINKIINNFKTKISHASAILALNNGVQENILDLRIHSSPPGLLIITLEPRVK